MEESDNKPKIKFAPGAFDAFEGSQEELDAMVADIQQLIESGEIFNKTVAVDMDDLKTSDPELYDDLMNQILKSKSDSERMH